MLGHYFCVYCKHVTVVFILSVVLSRGKKCHKIVVLHPGFRYSGCFFIFYKNLGVKRLYNASGAIRPHERNQ